MGDSVESQISATSATLDSHVKECERNAGRVEDQFSRLREWMNGQEKRIGDLEVKGKAMETKIAIFAALAAFVGSVFGPKMSALFGG